MASYRYWRVQFQNSNGGSSGYVALYEMAMRTTIAGINDMVGKTLTATNGAGQNPYNLTDSLPTIWYDLPASTCWVQCDFGSAVEIRQLDMTNRNDAFWSSQSPTAFILQGSSDGTTMTDVYTVSSITTWTQGSTESFYPYGYVAPGTRRRRGYLGTFG